MHARRARRRRLVEYYSMMSTVKFIRLTEAGELYRRIQTFKASLSNFMRLSVRFKQVAVHYINHDLNKDRFVFYMSVFHNMQVSGLSFYSVTRSMQFGTASSGCCQL